MAWVRLDDQFLTHPKALAAGKNGRALFIAGLLYTAGQLTDGRIARSQLGLIAAAAEVPATATARKLVEVGMWHVTDDGWEIHDYHHHNPTAEEVLERRRVRAEAGRKGGLRSRPKGSKSEATSEANASANGKRNGTPSPSPPSTSPPPTPTALGSAVPAAGASGEEEDRPTPDPADPSTWTRRPDGTVEEPDRPRPTPAQAAAKVDAALDHMAECDLRRAQAEGTKIRQPDAWRRKAAETRRAAVGQELLDRALASRPDVDPVDLAELVDDTCGPLDGGAARADAAWRAQEAELDARDAKAAAYRAAATEAESWLDAHPDERDRLLEQATTTVAVSPTGPVRDALIRRALISVTIDHLGLEA